MSLYAIPSFFALIIKAGLFWFGRDTLISSHKALFCFLLALFFLNFAEFNLFFYTKTPTEAEGMIRLYWVSAAFSVSIFVFLASHFANYSFSVLKCVTPAVIFATVILFSDFLIAGAQSIGYSVTRVKGDYYNLLQIYIVINLLIGLLTLFYAGLKHNNQWTRKKCSVIFVGMLPTVFAVIGVLVLMQLGYVINATVIVSVTILFLLATIIFTEKKYSLLNLLRIAPMSKESRYLKKILDPSIKFLMFLYSGKKISLKQQMKKIESILISTALEENNGDRHATAEQLGISKSGLDVKLRNSK